MADVYLIRKTNGTYVKYEGCTAVALTGQVTAWSSITGVAATNVITVTGSAFINGQTVEFTSLTGGSGLSTGVKYYVVNASGATFKLATTQGGTEVDFTTNITAGSLLLQDGELYVWSAEFRDIYSMTTNLGDGIVAQEKSGYYFASFTGSNTGADPTATQSDEVKHNPLRQTFLARTHWKFTMSAGASPLYATWADGDIIANNPPNTP